MFRLGVCPPTTSQPVREVHQLCLPLLRQRLQVCRAPSPALQGETVQCLPCATARYTARDREFVTASPGLAQQYS